MKKRIKKINMRLEWPIKIRRAISKKARMNEKNRLVSARDEVYIYTLKGLIADGLVRPSKIERQMCGIDED